MGCFMTSGKGATTIALVLSQTGPRKQTEARRHCGVLMKETSWKAQWTHSFSSVRFAAQLAGASESHCQRENKVMRVNNLMGTQRLKRSGYEIWEEDQEYQRGNNGMEKPSQTHACEPCCLQPPACFQLCHC